MQHKFWLGDRPAVVGLATFERRFSPRVSNDALWESLEAACFPAKTDELAKGFGGTDWEQEVDAARFRSFIKQAKDFYTATNAVSSAAKPLPAYYFVLNLAKAYLTLRVPAQMRTDKIPHGVIVVKGGDYEFENAKSEAKPNGVFPLLAGHTGTGATVPNPNPIEPTHLLPYLLEATAEYTAMSGQRPRLIEIEDIHIVPNLSSPPFLNVHINAGLVEKVVGAPSDLAESAALFGAHFEYHIDHPGGFEVYTSRKKWTKEEVDNGTVQRDWVSIFDQALIGVDRTQGNGRTFITLDKRTDLISYEAITFLMAHHLSEMARYRPYALDKLLTSQYAWVLTSWLPRACENYLLTMATRITGEEHRISG